MMSLETLAALEQKVEHAIARIETLTRENTQLKEQCTKYEAENAQLRQHMQSFLSDQQQLEQGILNALNRLDTVENAVIKTAQAAEAAVPNTAQQPGPHEDAEEAVGGQPAQENAGAPEAQQEMQPYVPDAEQYAAAAEPPVPDAELYMPETESEHAAPQAESLFAQQEMPLDPMIQTADAAYQADSPSVPQDAYVPQDTVVSQNSDGSQEQNGGYVAPQNGQYDIF